MQVIARKSLSSDVPKKETGDYEEFLCGDWEFSNHPDQVQCSQSDAMVASMCNSEHLAV
jgi:hypothetical protein